MNLLKSSSIYLISSVLNKSIPFLLLPLLTKYLTPNEYGILAIFLLMIQFYSAFIGMNMPINISKNFFVYNRDQLSNMVGNMIIILTGSTALLLLITFFVSQCFDDIFSVPSNWVLIVPIICFMFMINTMNLTILRNEEKAIWFGLFQIINTAISAGVTVLLLVVYEYGWYSQAIGVAIGHFLFCIVSILYMEKKGYIRLNIDLKEIKNILLVSVPLIPHVVGNIVISLSDRFFIEKMVSLEAVGIYSIGYMFGMIVMLFTDAFVNSWSPWFYKMLAHPTIEKKIKIVKYSYIYILAIFILAVAISIVAYFIIPYFIDERYFGANQYIFWIAFGYVIHGIYKIFFPYLVHINRTAFLGYSTTLAALCNLGFNYLFIKEFGAIGAAYATVLSFAISAALVIWYQNRYFEMPWALNKIGKSTLE